MTPKAGVFELNRYATKEDIMYEAKKNQSRKYWLTPITIPQR